MSVAIRRKARARVLSQNTRRTCESCGKRARVRLPDGSAWCGPCDEAAIRLGYDKGGAT